MNRIFFVLNDYNDFTFNDLLSKHLSDCLIDLGTRLPVSASDYSLIILWNYKKIIKDLPVENNVILFHSSKLPLGKGWAPIYYTLAEGKKEFVISGILADPKVDSGDVVVRARFDIDASYTADDLRKFDNEISIIMISLILQRFSGRVLVGFKQIGQESVNKRRWPENSKFDINKKFVDLIPHLRACEKGSPAFFEYNNAFFNIRLESRTSVKFPDNIVYEFGEDLIENN